MLSRIGPHELKPTPDDVLVKLNPQFMVTVGTYEHGDAINRHLARVRHLQHLLPKTIIGVRWWKDDNILNVVTPDGYADVFFKLHVPGTVLFVGNEDDNSHSNPEILKQTVAKHLRVAQLATEAHIPLGLCCLSTGNPAKSQYHLLLPLFREMENARKVGVVHWWRLNRYRTATDTSHFLEHEEALRGIRLPPIVIGEVGVVKSYSEPEAGYLAMGWGEETYASSLTTVVKKYPFVFYCEGEGVYDDRWRYFEATPKLWNVLADQIERTSKTAFQEWSDRDRMTQGKSEPRIAKATVKLNLRPTASTLQPVLTTIPVGAEFTIWKTPLIKVGALEWVNASYEGKEGFVAGPSNYTVTEPLPPVDPGVMSEFLTDDEIQQLIIHHTGIATHHVAIAKIYQSYLDRRTS